jgi:hypothetical protein
MIMIVFLVMVVVVVMIAGGSRSRDGTVQGSSLGDMTLTVCNSGLDLRQEVHHLQQMSYTYASGRHGVRSRKTR